ncbi:tetratricopeptide repeat protein [Brevibacillus dissolubilis]|uniref:tetratricopeptide repeat protein n=1 Tax=Brevibacillus dissolubilis TaxID=1844116 RepID=UPI001115BA8E|nr:hypothetical protein [Brevibacillus dissolubilis]
MDYLELNWVSTLSGVAVVLLVAFIRLHWPFRYQYMSVLTKRRPERVLYWLEASYRKNGRKSVAMLDKSSHEILTGNLEQAERYIAEGLSSCKERPTLFNQALVHYLFYNLSTVYFYRGKYKDAIDVAFRVYERDENLTNALGIIVCSQARLGDIQSAVEAFSMINKKKLKPALEFFCLAEIAAAKGDFPRAVDYLQKCSTQPYILTMHLNPSEIDKRLDEWTKASSQVG